MTARATTARKRLSMALRTPTGAIDLASIMVGVIVLAVIALGGVAATVFAVIPWAQDGAAEASLRAYQTAQSVAQAKDGRFMTTSELVDHGYLPEKARAAASGPRGIPEGGRGMSVPIAEPPAGDDDGAALRTALGAGGSCYVASLRSDTGTVFYITSKTPAPEPVHGADPDTTWCVGFPALAATGPVTPPAAIAVWTAQASAAQLAWKTVTVSTNGQRIGAIDGDGAFHGTEDGGETWYASTGPHLFTDLAATADGKTLYAGSTNPGETTGSDYTYTSADAGHTWQMASSLYPWGYSEVAMSASGTIRAAVGRNMLFVSQNGGATWKQQTTPYMGGVKSNLTVSTDGKDIAAVAGTSILTSFDSGTTWAALTVPGAGSMQITFSQDSSTMFVSRDGSYVYRSTDHGISWSPLTTLGTGRWLTISTTGTNLVAQRADDHNLHISSDSGQTWSSTQPNASVGTFTSIATSGNGTTLTAVPAYGFINISADGGQTWKAISGPGLRGWVDTYASADGTTMAAISTKNTIHVSTDSGTTWLERTLPANPIPVAIAGSDNGKTLIAPAATSWVWASQDSGASWPLNSYTDYKGTVTDVTVSANGTMVAAAFTGGYILTSTNGGAKWVKRTASESRAWNSIVSSADGMQLFAGVAGGYAYRSSDGGATWTEVTAGGPNTTSVASSADGQHLFIAESDGRVMVSTDGGATWGAEAGPADTSLSSLTVSDDGRKIAGVGTDGYLYASQNAGASWIRQDAPHGNWRSVSSSADGKKLVAVQNGGYLYTGVFK